MEYYYIQLIKIFLFLHFKDIENILQKTKVFTLNELFKLFNTTYFINWSIPNSHVWIHKV